MGLQASERRRPEGGIMASEAWLVVEQRRFHSGPMGLLCAAIYPLLVVVGLSLVVVVVVWRVPVARRPTVSPWGISVWVDISSRRQLCGWLQGPPRRHPIRVRELGVHLQQFFVSSGARERSLRCTAAQPRARGDSHCR